MQRQNIREYELLRTEILSIKSCITSYMGYVLGGSGAALFGLAIIGRQAENVVVLAYAPGGVSVVITLVLLVLFYKFNSHNRVAGYCKALNQESYKDQERDDLLSWELCIQQLRNSDERTSSIIEVAEKNADKLDNIPMDKLLRCLNNLTGKPASVDQGKWREGWKILINSFISPPRTCSWGFPIFVTLIFFVLTSIFILVSLIFFTLILNASVLFTYLFHLFFMVFIIIFHVLMWTRIAGKLYTLMRGSATVNGFFIRFIPLRADFLIQYGLKPEYRIDETELQAFM